MTIWCPEIESAGVPRYRAIADSLARDVAEGRLAPGTRLPTHRALAAALGVTVGTVSRAYEEAARVGLVSGEVGRGTFVREPLASLMPFDIPDEDRDGLVDLSRNVPDPGPAAERLRDALEQLAARSRLEDLLDYLPPAGSARHRAAGARWVSRAGLDVGPDEIVVASGAQHATMLALASLARPGETILSGALTYPGIIALARLLQLRLEGLALDEEGVRPDAFESACRAGAVRALYVIPTLQNPTAAVMSEARRRELAAIARRHDVALIEDDILGFLPESPPACLASFAPERTFIVTSLSKCAAPGLRVGYLRAPGAYASPVAACMRTMMWMAPPLSAEVASLWIEDGTAERLAELRREESRERSDLARRLIGAAEVRAPRETYHAWVRLPEPWRAADFALQARARGVGVSPAEAFVVGRDPAPHAVRLCLAAPRRREELARALDVLRDLMASPSVPAESVV